MKLRGRVAVIAGAGSGIGRASALEFAREGASVVVADSNAAGAQEGAIITLTKALAIDHGKEGIRVNCICPGYIDAGLAWGYFDAHPDAAAARAAAGKLHALWGIGKPDEVGRVAVFLASDDASFMRGAAVVADGGFGSGLPRQS